MAQKSMTIQMHPLSIQNESGARIQIHPGGDTRNVTIIGTKDETEAARVALDAIINPPTVVLTCEQRQARHLIGHRGSTIRRSAIRLTATFMEGDSCKQEIWDACSGGLIRNRNSNLKFMCGNDNAHPDPAAYTHPFLTLSRQHANTDLR